MESFDQICRSCNNERTNCKSIFEDKLLSSTKGIHEMLSYCSQMEVDINDKYPKQICYLCATQLEISYGFLLRYRKSIQEFDKILSCLAQPQNDNDGEASTLRSDWFNLKTLVKEESEQLVEDYAEIQNQEEFFFVEQLDDMDVQTLNGNDLKMSANEDHNELNAAGFEEENTTITESEEHIVEEEICLPIDKTWTNKAESDPKDQNSKDFSLPKMENIKEVTPEEQLRKFSCPECQISFYTSSAFSLHQKIKHKIKKTMQVDIHSCSKISKSYENILMKNKKSICKATVNYGCNVCLKTFSSRVKLSLHMKKHSN